MNLGGGGTAPKGVPAWFGRKGGVVGPVASALLLALAFAGAWPLVFVALVPWLLSLRETTPRQAWNRGYAFGLLFSLTQLWWLGDLGYKWTGSVLLGVVPWLLASLASAVYYGLLGRLVRSCIGLNALWAIPLVWAGIEVFRSYIPVLAFPWALLGEPLIAVPALAGGAWYGTIYLVSGLVVAANVALLSASRTKAFKAFAAIGAAFVLAAIPFGEGSRGAGQRFAAGQIGVDMAFDHEADSKVGPAVDGLSAQAQGQGVDLLVLSEGIVPHAGPSIPPLTPFRIPEAPPIVFGGQRGTGPAYQSAFAHDTRGWSYADKTRLVIFGEFVPGRDFLPFLAAFDLPTGDLSAGDRLSTVRAGEHTVGPLICFEALFPDLGLRQARAGADVLATMSIDDWFAPPARQRLARAAQWRAVEAGLPLVRAGSLGRTMIVSPFGEVLADAPFGASRLVVASVGRGRGPFPLVWLFPLLALGSLVGVPAAVRLRRSSARASL